MSLASAKKKKLLDGRYEVLSIVGRGAESVVYHARHVQGPEQEVALKVLVSQKDPNSLMERARKEALTLVSCRHKYVVRLDDYQPYESAKLCYLSMEYAPLGDLRKYLESTNPQLSFEKAELFLRQMLEALSFVHSTGVIHRDVKPENILLVSDSETRLADFGLALLPGDEASLDELRHGVGTFPYLPPEVLDGIRYDSRSDLYALGLCFYEALVGEHPFASLPLAQQRDARDDSAIKPLELVRPGIPTPLASVVTRLMRCRAEERFQSADEAIAALNDPNFSLTPSDSPGISRFTPLSGAANVDEPLREESEYSAAVGDYEGRTDDEEGAPRRVSNPTERIDLERIKEILAKDSQLKAEAAARRAKRDQAMKGITTEPTPAPSSDLTPESPEIEPVAEEPAFTENEPPRPTRIPKKKSNFFLVVFAFLALTIVAVGVLSTIKSFLREPKTELTSDATQAQATVDPVHREADSQEGAQTAAQDESQTSVEVGDAVATNTSSVASDSIPQAEDTVVPPAVVAVAQEPIEKSSEKVEQVAPVGFPRIPKGLFVGQMNGLPTSKKVPFALLSFPDQNALAVIIGIEGWTPVMVSTNLTNDDPSETVTVRSGGVIITLTGTLNGTTVQGTFRNSITGETGSWSVKQVS
jgi:serine/threonine protein kinase